MREREQSQRQVCGEEDCQWGRVTTCLFVFWNNLFKMESLGMFSKLALAFWTQVIFLPQPPESSHITTPSLLDAVFSNEPSVSYLWERANVCWYLSDFLCISPTVPVEADTHSPLKESLAVDVEVEQRDGPIGWWLWSSHFPNRAWYLSMLEGEAS